jgi:hydroxypyruvate isomerase
MPKLSANLGFLWPDRPLLDRIDAAAAAGFPAIELHWPYDVAPETVRSRCERHGLALVAINATAGARPDDFGLGAAPGRRADFRDGFARAADYARRAGAAAIHVLAGNVEPGDAERARATFLDNLAWAAAAAPDLRLLLEPMNRIDRPAYFYATIAEAAAIVDALAAPNVAIMFDAYHVGMGGADPVATFRAHFPRIGHVQIAGAPARAEPDEGVIDYARFFATLDALGYAGWVGCEYRPRGATDAGLGWRAALGVAPRPVPTRRERPSDPTGED